MLPLVYTGPRRHDELIRLASAGFCRTIRNVSCRSVLCFPSPPLGRFTSIDIQVGLHFHACLAKRSYIRGRTYVTVHLNAPFRSAATPRLKDARLLNYAANGENYLPGRILVPPWTLDFPGRTRFQYRVQASRRVSDSGLPLNLYPDPLSMLVFTPPRGILMKHAEDISMKNLRNGCRWRRYTRKQEIPEPFRVIVFLEERVAAFAVAASATPARFSLAHLPCRS